MVHQPVEVAEHERLLTHIAVDAGADVVFASHAHLLRGCEVYKGKTIYHGLNNFVQWNPKLSPAYSGKRGLDPVYDAWIAKRVERFGFIPDPEYPTYPFHPDSIYTVAAKCVIEDKQLVKTLLVPMIVPKSGITQVVQRRSGGQQIFDYMRMITKEARLNAEYEWEGDDILICRA